MEYVFRQHLAAQKFVVLDGALATELERHGADLNDPLWSAKLLLENPALIQQVHLDYLLAGADVITTASYQATFEGFAQRGIPPSQAKKLLQRSVQLAHNARDEFWSKTENRKNRLRPLVAASIGPYGAYLADGSEYRGKYGLTVGQLKAFHRPRWQALLQAGPDLLACETIPCLEEAQAYVEMLGETPQAQAWLSFSCQDAAHLSDGSKFCEAVKLAEGCGQVVAVGVKQVCV